MKKLNLEKCGKSNKGITLIALIITIIILLILAGVTIAALTGSDSAPAKANEAKQKQDIGAAKDEVTIAAQNAQTLAYERVYVEGKQVNSNTAVTAGNASTQVGSYVISELNKKYPVSGTAKVGLATITVTDAGEITISTTDFTQPGSINPDGGILTWNEMTANGGTQQAELPEDSVQKLAQAGQIQRWDKINYNPGNGTTASIDLPEGAKIEGTKLAALSLPNGASLDGTIDASDASDWVVLDVNQTTGEVKIMPQRVSSTKLSLSGVDGYNNAITALDAVAGIYLNSAQAESARSIRIEDIDKVEGHIPNGEVGTANLYSRFGVNEELNITDEGEGNTKNQIIESTEETGYYTYNLNYLYNNQKCFVASRKINPTTFGQSKSCSFHLMGVRRWTCVLLAYVIYK